MMFKWSINRLIVSYFVFLVVMSVQLKGYVTKANSNNAAHIHPPTPNFVVRGFSQNQAKTEDDDNQGFHFLTSNIFKLVSQPE